MQVPGSRSQYNNVFQALQEIAKQEGLKGLYRYIVGCYILVCVESMLSLCSLWFDIPNFIADQGIDSETGYVYVSRSSLLCFI